MVRAKVILKHLADILVLSGKRQRRLQLPVSLTEISTMPARCQEVCLYFLFSLSFFGTQTPLTPKEVVLFGSVKLLLDDHGLVSRNLSVGPSAINISSIVLRP